MQKTLNTTQPNIIPSKIIPSKLDVRDKAIKKAIPFIAKWEGCKLQAYLCPAKVWTIGYGTTSINGKPISPTLKITQQEAEKYLQDYITNDLDQIWKDVWQCNSNQIAAILSFVYNCGMEAWQKSTLRKLIINNPNGENVLVTNPPRNWREKIINANTFKSNNIIIEFLKWNKANGKVVDGLTNRRVDESKLYFSKD